MGLKAKLLLINICNISIYDYPLFHGNIFLKNKRKMNPNNNPSNIPKNILMNNVYNCDYFTLENKMMTHSEGSKSLNSSHVPLCGIFLQKC